jgi:hypothetical protein
MLPDAGVVVAGIRGLVEAGEGVCPIRCPIYLPTLSDTVQHEPDETPDQTTHSGLSELERTAWNRFLNRASQVRFLPGALRKTS